MAFNKHEFELFKELTELDGIASRENQIRNYLKKKYQSLGLEIVNDNLGGCFAYKKSKNKDAFKVMIDAHMDEVGFIVSNFKDDGKLELIPIGYIEAKDANNVKAKLLNQNGETFIGDLISNEEEMLLDLGFKSKEEALSKNINFNDMVTFINEFHQGEDKNRYFGKAIDDRYGLVLGIEVLESLINKDLPFDLYVGGSVQEEVGLRGAGPIVNLIKPDLVIALDCSRAVLDNHKLGHIGEGVLLRFYDRSMVAFPELIALQKEACEKSNSKYQYFTTGGATNAGKIHLELNGILTLTHCICAINIHTSNTEMDSRDYQAAKSSLLYLLENLDKNTLEMLRNYRK